MCALKLKPLKGRVHNFSYAKNLTQTNNYVYQGPKVGSIRRFEDGLDLKKKKKNSDTQDLTTIKACRNGNRKTHNNLININYCGWLWAV